MVDLWTYLRNVRWGWVDAVKKAEKSGDLEPLARLLRSDTPMEKATCVLLAELFDRHRLGRKRGRPKSSDLALLAGSADLAPLPACSARTHRWSSPRESSSRNCLTGVGWSANEVGHGRCSGCLHETGTPTPPRR
jgi:hypothetical protein